MMQTMTQSAMEAATKAAIAAVKEVENTVNAARSIQVMYRSDGPALKQPKFDWKAAGKYQELLNFETDVKSIFITIAISYNIMKRSQLY